MAKRTVTMEELATVRRLARKLGVEVARQAFGDSGPGKDVDLATLESVAQAAAEGVALGTVERMLSQQAEQFGEEQPCPACGRACDLVPRERELVIAHGRVETAEPAAHCPDCRRDFFPSA